MKQLNFVLLIISLLGLLASCNSTDGNFIPYGLKGLDVYVYNNVTDKEYYGGRIRARYWDKAAARQKCNELAHETARQHNIRDWSYVCCTVTSTSSCVTKVR